MKEGENIRISNNCLICCGRGFITLLDNMQCSFCNGTGEYTKAADSYMKVHACQCFVTVERRECPLCGERCHHTTNNKPTIELAPRM